MAQWLNRLSEVGDVSEPPLGELGVNQPVEVAVEAASQLVQFAGERLVLAADNIEQDEDLRRLLLCESGEHLRSRGFCRRSAEADQKPFALAWMIGRPCAMNASRSAAGIWHMRLACLCPICSFFVIVLIITFVFCRQGVRELPRQQPVLAEEARLLEHLHVGQVS